MIINSHVAQTVEHYYDTGVFIQTRSGKGWWFDSIHDYKKLKN